MLQPKSKFHFSIIVLSFFSFLIISCNEADNTDHSQCVPVEGASTDIGNSVLVDFGEQTDELFYERHAEYMITEGDIIIGEIPEDMEWDEDVQVESLVQLGRKWTDGIIPYSVNSALPDKQRVELAIEELGVLFEGVFTFIERTDQENYIEFVTGGGCYSSVGMIGGRQIIGLTSGCGKAEVLHEIGHALGLWHEQSRSDRDSWIEVRWCNIDEAKRSNFLKRTLNTYNFESYDYDSIMHYNAYAFSNNGKKTIVSLTDGKVPDSNPQIYSEQDIRALKCLYGNGDNC